MPEALPGVRVLRQHHAEVSRQHEVISHSNSSVTYRIGGREYPFRSEPNCLTCQSHYRTEIENALLKGYSYASIARTIPQAQLTSNNIYEHVHKGHMPLDEHLRLVVIEQRATELGRDIQRAEGVLGDHVTFARLGVQRVIERMQVGELVPTIENGIQFASLLLRLDEFAGESVDQQAIAASFMAFMRAAREVMTTEQFTRFGKLLDRDPVLHALSERGTQVVEAQVEAS
jgi:hypothetical protein